MTECIFYLVLTIDTLSNKYSYSAVHFTPGFSCSKDE